MIDIITTVIMLPLLVFFCFVLFGALLGLYLEQQMDYINGKRIQAENEKDYDRLARLNDRMARVARIAARLERILYLDFRG